MDRPLSVQSLIDLYLQARDDYFRERPIAGKVRWRASKLGLCLRSQWLAAMGVEEERADVQGLRKFAVGRIYGLWLEWVFRDLGILIDREVPMFDEELQLGGHLDLLIGGVVCLPQGKEDSELLRAIQARVVEEFGPVLPIAGIENKSVHSRSFWYGRKHRGGQVAQRHQLLQGAAYRVLADRTGLEPRPDTWRLLSVSRDDITFDEAGVTAAHVAEALDRVETLNEAWESGSPPPCTCDESWERDYCRIPGDGQVPCCSVPSDLPRAVSEGVGG